SALNFERRIVSRPLAMVRVRSDRARPSVFVPTSIPMSRPLTGNAPAKAPTSRMTAASGAAFTQASAAGGLSPVIRALYLQSKLRDRPKPRPNRNLDARPRTRIRPPKGVNTPHEDHLVRTFLLPHRNREQRAADRSVPE